MPPSLAHPSLTASPGTAGAPGLRPIDLAVAAALLTTGLLLCTAPALLNDPDTFWHIATGRLIWQSGHLPLVDGFSHTFAGAPWIAKEWLSQLILFAAYALAGWTGVVLVTAFAVGGCMAVLCHALSTRMRPTLAVAVLLVAFLLAAPSLVARPHVLVLPVVALWTAGLVTALEQGRAPPLWLAGLVVLWANLHASYPLGLGLAGLLAGEGVLAAPGRRRQVAAAWALFLAVAAGAALVTPYGLRTAGVIADLLTTPESTRFITEWQPVRADGEGALLVAALAAAAAALLPEVRTTLCRLVVTGLLGYAALRHVRFTLMVAVIVPLLVAGPVGRLAGLGPRPAGPRWGARRARSFLAVLLPVAVVAVLVAVIHPVPRPAVAPEAALRFARQAGLTGNVYNDYGYGGFLIAEGVPTFIDGRSDQLFGGGFTTALNAAIDAPDGAAFAAILTAHQVRWALVRTGSGDARHLDAMPGWSRLFDSDGAAVYALRTGLSQQVRTRPKM